MGRAVHTGGLASYVVLHPRRKGKTHNSVSHAEIAVAAVQGYYHGIHERVHSKDPLIDFGDYIKGILKGLGKLYSTVPQRRLPLLADAINTVINLGSYTLAALCTLWLAQWQGVMRGSDILKHTDRRARKWNPDQYTHLGTVPSEEVSPGANYGCSVEMRWRLKPMNTDQTGAQGFEKTFLLDISPDSLSAAQGIRHILALRCEVNTKREESQLFLNAQMRDEISLIHSRR